MPAPPETDVARIRMYCRARVPASFRDKIRIEAAVRGSSVSIYECRPPWHPDLTEWSKVRVAQLRYSADTHHWSLYWADRNGRWHPSSSSSSTTTTTRERQRSNRRVEVRVSPPAGEAPEQRVRMAEDCLRAEMEGPSRRLRGRRSPTESCLCRAHRR